ncbi:hypothetical protein WR25_02567 [Diploscapter pachys]|uniref:Cdc23 domain-containing protein n=1 Tax=Diploscapter pachys TaxID=2018661 RepID=A0A2A2LA43_9BILA|nr:hypothetical protein WR25_02567 [Diploscapter pachys]
MFLFFWSKYLAFQRVKLEDDAESLENKAHEKDTDADMRELLTVVEEHIDRGQFKQDPFLILIQCLIELNVGLRDEARKRLTRLVRIEPRLWPAWKELAALVANIQEVELIVQVIGKDSQWMCDLFASLALSRLHQYDRARRRVESLSLRGLSMLPIITTQMAVCASGDHDHATAIRHFNAVRHMDPYRIDCINTYCDSLYVEGERALIADLAHTLFKYHKYRWETCNVVGNYYSQRGERENAIRFFQRALRLNPNLVCVWVLIGHEFMERKNVSAACLAYRRAIEIDENDYLGWYSLGQAYDILKMESFALYYYQQAHKCRPNDSRMIVPLGEIYKRLNRPADAEKCFAAAYIIGDVEGNAAWNLATLYKVMYEDDHAAMVYKKILDDLDREPKEISGAETNRLKYVECLLYLARTELKKENLDQAEYYANRCTQNELTSMEGNYILREIIERRKAKQASTTETTINTTGEDDMMIEEGDDDIIDD